MSEWLLPSAVLLAAVGSTYLFCLRPMRRGGCADSRSWSSRGNSDLDRALHQARRELQRTREGLDLESGHPMADRHVPVRGIATSGPASATVSPAERPRG